MKNNEIELRVEESLEKIRPYLRADGGDVRLVDISDDFTVRIEMTGACDGCAFSIYTLKAGIEEGLKKDIPEIKEVIAVNI